MGNRVGMYIGSLELKGIKEKGSSIIKDADGWITLEALTIVANEPQRSGIFNFPDKSVRGSINFTIHPLEKEEIVKELNELSTKPPLDGWTVQSWGTIDGNPVKLEEATGKKVQIKATGSSEDGEKNRSFRLIWSWDAGGEAMYTKYKDDEKGQGAALESKQFIDETGGLEPASSG